MLHCLLFILLVSFHPLVISKRIAETLTNKDLPIEKEEALNGDGLDYHMDDEDEAEDDLDFSDQLPYHPVHGVDNPVIQDMIVRAQRPSCSERKCRRFYRGYWASSCDAPNYRAVAYCKGTSLWCCARCEMKKWCMSKPDAVCVMKATCDKLGFPFKRRRGCRGKWWCCHN